MTFELFFNELSACHRDKTIEENPASVREKLYTFAELLSELGKHGMRVLRTNRDFRSIEFAPEYTLGKWMSEPESLVSREVKRIIRSRTTKAPYLEGITEIIDDSGVFEHGSVFCEFKFEEQVIHGLAAAWLLDGLCVSLNSEVCWDSPEIIINRYQINSTDDTDSIEDFSVRHASQNHHTSQHVLFYSPTKKHESWGWGTEMDLDFEIAQFVLQNSVAANGKKQRYGFYNGKCYAFQPDNAGAYHGYYVSGTEVPDDVFKKLLKKKLITDTDHNSLRKQSAQ